MSNLLFFLFFAEQIEFFRNLQCFIKGFYLRNLLNKNLFFRVEKNIYKITDLKV